MNIKQARALIPCETFLAHEGHEPAYSTHGGRYLWYRSPLRKGDNDPSFKVDTDLRTWYDFGLMQGGHVVKLVADYYKEELSDALRRLDRTNIRNGGLPTPSPTPQHPRNYTTSEFNIGTTQKPVEGHKITKVLSLAHPALVNYLQTNRQISPRIFLAQKHIKEIHFETPNKTKLFAIGCQSKEDGYELRNEKFKGCIGKKAITHIIYPGAITAYIFGGWLDHLSLLEDKGITEVEASVIFPNSDGMIEETLQEIIEYKYKEVLLFADNDASGERMKAFFKERLSEIGVRLIDASSDYEGFKDYNDMIRGIRLDGKSRK